MPSIAATLLLAGLQGWTPLGSPTGLDVPDPHFWQPGREWELGVDPFFNGTSILYRPAGRPRRVTWFTETLTGLRDGRSSWEQSTVLTYDPDGSCVAEELWDEGRPSFRRSREEPEVPRQVTIVELELLSGDARWNTFVQDSRDLVIAELRTERGQEAFVRTSAPLDLVRTFEYDVRGRLLRACNPNRRECVDWWYDEVGRVARVEIPYNGGKLTDFHYDSAGHLRHSRSWFPGSRELVEIEWTYDEQGRPVEACERVDGFDTRTELCAYGARGELVERTTFRARPDAYDPIETIEELFDGIDKPLSYREFAGGRCWLSRTWEYRVDARGNWTHQFPSDDLAAMRVIEYAD